MKLYTKIGTDKHSLLTSLPGTDIIITFLITFTVLAAS